MAQTKFTAKLFSFRRFSLRTFLILVLLAGCGFGGLTRWYHTVQDSGNAQLRLIEASNPSPLEPPVFEAQYASREQPTWFTSLVRKWVHSEYNRPFAVLSFGGHLIDTARANDVRSAFGVESLNLSGNAISPQNAALLFQAKGLKGVGISTQMGGASWTDEVVQQLKHAQSLKLFSTGLVLSDQSCLEVSKLPELTELRLQACTPEGIAILAKSKKLEKLDIKSIRHSTSDFRGPEQSERDFTGRTRLAMTQALKALAQNQNFSHLSIDGTLGLTREDVAEFCLRSKIKTLDLRSPEIAPECLEEFAKLSSLESLTIYDLSINDQHLPPLATAKNLKRLAIGPNVSGDAIRALREQMPGCEIDRF